jgi:integrase
LTAVIAALAPMLRVGTILALRWDRHVSPDLRQILEPGHKTARATGLPLLTPVSEPLQRVLAAAKAARDQEPATELKKDRSEFVVRYRGRPVKTIDTGLKAACEAAGVRFGRAEGGVTFHTIRHTAATRLAELGITESIRKEAMGHASMTMTQRYTHLAAAHIAPAVEQLSAALALVGPVVELPPKRARRGRAEPPAAPSPTTATIQKSARKR